ncbi:DegV family protein [Anoxynatronum sibiricum]|uniref:DegV family protein n=1 Tax=Anoxynatronum sibiricum TaxID=210623 RepID=A0ABU9VTT1_9CLOT
MRTIQLITDSMTDIPRSLAEKHHIQIVPLTIFFGAEAFLDGVDLTSKDFYHRLNESETLPSTSQVTPAAFQAAFEKALADGKQVLCINASSKASGTHQSALIAKETIGSADICVVDTMGLCMGAGLTVLETARRIESGATLEEAASFAASFAVNITHLFTVDTVKYLQKGGRINPGKAMMANILNIKPILTVRDGLVDPLDKVRGSKKVIHKMLELALQQQRDLTDKTIVIAHSNVSEKAAVFQQEAQEMLKPKEIILAEIGCTIGTHTGPGTLALFFHHGNIA